MSRTDMRRGMRGLIASAAAALGVAGLAVAICAALAPAGVRADTGAVAFDHQNYAAVNSTPDAFNNDQTATHVGYSVTQTTYQAFYHLDLSGVPAGATFTSVTAHLPLAVSKTAVPVDSAGNVNNTSAVMEACALTAAYPATFDPKNPPAGPCSNGSAAGVMDSKDGSFTFDLTRLLPYWSQHGNTGFLLDPIGAAGDNWAVAFDVGTPSATVTYTPRGSSSTVTTTTTASSSSSASTTSSATSRPGAPVSYYAPPVTAPLPVATPAPASTPTPAPATAAPSAAPTQAPGGIGPTSGTTPPAATSGSGSSRWPWILALSLLAAFAIVAVPLVRAGRETLAPLTREVRSHPRAFGAAAVVLAWCVTFGAYSAANQPSSSSAGAGIASAAGAGASSSSAASSEQSSSASAGATAVPGAAASSTSSGAAGAQPAGGAGAGQAAAGPGGGTTTSSTSSSGAPPVADGPAPLNLFSADQDQVGITATSIRLCGHAALTFGPAFNIGASDLNVFWQNLNAHGGINGRKVLNANGQDGMDFFDDGYQASKAVQAAQSCQSENAFAILGGIGFDQIPSVRSWAEANRQLYIYHIAELRGSQGLRYSYTALPTVEQMGTDFGELVATRHHSDRIGMVYRDSPNWTPGSDAFTSVLQSKGMGAPLGEPVSANASSYAQQITDLKTNNVQTVFLWLNALESTEFIKQAHQQLFDPQYELFPFNLTLQTLTNGEISTSKPLEGLAAWPAYAAGQYDGNYSSYAADIHEFEREYAQYDKNANLSGPGGDLLFLAWAGFKGMADMLQACGHNCTRNRLAAVMQDGYHKALPPGCDVNFAAGDHHHGGGPVDFFVTKNDPAGKVEWYPEQHCVNGF